MTSDGSGVGDGEVVGGVQGWGRIGVVGVTVEVVDEEVATLKIAARCFIAAICSVPIVGNGDAGAGLSRAAVSSRAASVAASAEEVAGMGTLWGKNSTERDILSARVVGM